LRTKTVYKFIGNSKQKYTTTTEKSCCPISGLLIATDVFD
jgi:hypothetical protein